MGLRTIPAQSVPIPARPARSRRRRHTSVAGCPPRQAQRRAPPKQLWPRSATRETVHNATLPFARCTIPKRSRRSSGSANISNGSARSVPAIWSCTNRSAQQSLIAKPTLSRLTFRSLDSFMRSFARIPRGFCPLAMSGGDADCRTR